MKKITYVSLALAACMAISCGQTNQNNSIGSDQNQVVETILARRSIRKYLPKPVEEKKLQKILECGINAPTGMYKQSWQIRVVQNPEFLAAIDQKFSEQRVREGKSSKAKAFYGDPCLIFIAYDKNYDLSQVDCGLLGENIILAAQSMGLGTCCLGQVARFMMSEDAKELLPRLEIPKTHELLYAISVGYPDQEPTAKPRDWNRIRFVDQIR